MGGFTAYDPRRPAILTVPGLGGSGRSHWQTLWEESRPDTLRVELGMEHAAPQFLGDEAR